MHEEQIPAAAVAACMRNEGLFLLEWVAYHQVVGFDRVIVVTNDCTDGSDALAARLSARGEVVHLPNAVPHGVAPQASGMAMVFEYLGQEKDPGWLLHIDADEFLCVNAGEGRVADLLAVAGEADVIALPWRFFGDAGLTDWPGGAVLTQFTRAEAAPDPDQVKGKAMFRVKHFGAASDHTPLAPKVVDPVVVNADGRPLKNAALYNRRMNRFRPLGRVAKAKSACINHYAAKSPDLFLMRNDRGDGQGNTSNKYHLGSRWHRIVNRNDVEARQILRLWPEVEARLARLRADPETAQLEIACRDWFSARKSQVLTPAAVAAWTVSEARV